MSLRLWVHEGVGHYVGSCYMCMAETEERATELIRAALDEAGLKAEQIKSLQWRRTDVEGVLYRNDGDY